MPKRKATLKDFISGNAGAEMVFRHLTFVFFLGFLGIIYIANSHYAEKRVRQIQALQKDVKELRWEYMSLKSEIMYNYKLSEVEKRVRQKGLKLNKPKKIMAED